MKKKKSAFPAYLLIFLLSIVFGYILGKMLSAIHLKGDVKLIWVLITALIPVFLSVIIHEAGHMLFGLLTGYGFSSFRIGSLMLVKEKGKLKFKRLSLAGTGGQCLMTPPEMQNGKIPFVLYNLGGALLNIIAAAIFGALYFAFKNAGYFTRFCTYSTLINLFFALENGIPLHIGLIDNDGYNCISMSKSGEALRAFCLQLKISEQTARGVRLKSMPEAWFTPPETDFDNSMITATEVFRTNRLLDMCEFEETAAAIDSLLSSEKTVIGLYKNLLTCDRIFCELMGERDVALLMSMRDKAYLKFIKQMKNFPSVIRTEYAFALIFERDREKAEKLKKQFEGCAKHHPYTVEIESERELIMKAEEKYGDN